MLGIESNVFKPRKLTAWAWNGKAKTPQFDFLVFVFPLLGKEEKQQPGQPRSC